MEFGIKIVQECQRQQAQCLTTCYEISMAVDTSDAAQLSLRQSHVRARILTKTVSLALPALRHLVTGF